MIRIERYLKSICGRTGAGDQLRVIFMKTRESGSVTTGPAGG
jgi:hypothetical protein